MEVQRGVQTVYYKAHILVPDGILYRFTHGLTTAEICLNQDGLHTIDLREALGCAGKTSDVRADQNDVDSVFGQLFGICNCQCFG